MTAICCEISETFPTSRKAKLTFFGSSKLELFGGLYSDFSLLTLLYNEAKVKTKKWTSFYDVYINKIK